MHNEKQANVNPEDFTISGPNDSKYKIQKLGHSSCENGDSTQKDYIAVNSTNKTQMPTISAPTTQFEVEMSTNIKTPRQTRHGGPSKPADQMYGMYDDSI